MKPLNLSRWQSWWLNWQERLQQAAQTSGWEDEDLSLPPSPNPSSWSQEAKAVLEELEEI
jgi:hypothetical protein